MSWWEDLIYGGLNLAESIMPEAESMFQEAAPAIESGGLEEEQNLISQVHDDSFYDIEEGSAMDVDDTTYHDIEEDKGYDPPPQQDSLVENIQDDNVGEGLAQEAPQEIKYSPDFPDHLKQFLPGGGTMSDLSNVAEDRGMTLNEFQKYVAEGPVERVVNNVIDVGGDIAAAGYQAERDLTQFASDARVAWENAKYWWSWVPGPIQKGVQIYAGYQGVKGGYHAYKGLKDMRDHWE